MREGGSEPGEVDVCSGEKMIEKSVEPRKNIYMCVCVLSIKTLPNSLSPNALLSIVF